MARCLLFLVLVSQPAPAQDVPRVGRQLAHEILFITGKAPAPCDTGTEAEQISCLIAARYAKDPAAAKAATALYTASGTVMGVLPEQDFDGGYRGRLHLIPQLPVGAHRKHLEWAAFALTDFDSFFKDLGGTPNYRWRALDFRFFESVKRRTPSAYAVDWAVAYNVSGSLFGSEAGVRGTLFHEVFHLNDQGHGDWSRRALSPIYDRIVKKCGVDVKCLTPYTPDSIKVRGGTYYDFQPGNGVGEYAADIARRYYTEHRALLRKEKAVTPFKCGNPDNAKAWALVVEEFFGGVDLIPACAPR
ncbi:MAG: hypothetical protein Q8L48_20590 [Archangium sp.]|nr:hypothetical protein [Archangium sp.]